MHYNNIDYCHYNGIYYRPYAGSYVVCRPPIGAIIPIAYISTTLATIVVNDTYNRPVNYYYDDGVFYSLYGSNYTVIRPPMGAVVAWMPSDYEEFYIGTAIVYVSDGVVYRGTINGGYEVIGYRTK